MKIKDKKETIDWRRNIIIRVTAVISVIFAMLTMLYASNVVAQVEKLFRLLGKEEYPLATNFLIIILENRFVVLTIVFLLSLTFTAFVFLVENKKYNRLKFQISFVWIFVWVFAIFLFIAGVYYPVYNLSEYLN